METGDGATLCFIAKNNHFDVSDKNLFEKIKQHCQNDEACQNDVFDCLSKLDQYQTENDVTINEEMIDQIVFESNICGNANFNRLVAIKILQIELGFDDDVAAYLLANAPSGCNQTCMLELAVASILGDGGEATIDYSLTSSNALVFSNFWDFQTFLTNPVSSLSGTTSNIGNGIFRTTVQMEYLDEYWPFNYGVFALIDSKLEEGNSQYELDAIESSPYGFMPLWDWSQIGSGIDMGNENIGVLDLGRMLRIDGEMKLGIIIADNPFAVKISGSFSLLINRKTGEFIESEWKPND